MVLLLQLPTFTTPTTLQCLKKYNQSPVAGMGGSLAIIGAAALGEAFEQHQGNVEAAFESYNHDLRPFVEEVQQAAVQTGLDMLVPRTEEAIQRRNAMTAGM